MSRCQLVAVKHRFPTRWRRDLDNSEKHNDGLWWTDWAERTSASVPTVSFIRIQSNSLVDTWPPKSASLCHVHPLTDPSEMNKNVEKHRIWQCLRTEKWKIHNLSLYPDTCRLWWGSFWAGPILHPGIRQNPLSSFYAILPTNQQTTSFLGGCNDYLKAGKHTSDKFKIL